MSDYLVDALQQLVETVRSDINTTVPGKVVSYNPATNRAVVIPSLPRKLANGVELAPPQIVEVPVMFTTSGMGGKQASLTFPIAPGDGVKLDFSQRSIEDWLSGSNVAPTDPRQFDLSDCIATPGLNSAGVVGDAENVVLRMDQSTVTLKPDNTIVLGNANGSITIAPDGTITLKGTSVIVDTPANTFAAETHRHTGVRAGPDTSSVPVP